LDARIEMGKSMCLRAKEEFAAKLGVDAEYVICNGEAPDVLSDVAREKGADLIALGTYGRRGLKRLIMGSVTSSVVVKSPCEVLVVRTNGKCHRYESILVPYDGSEFSRRALEKAARLAKENKSELTLIYVIPRYEEMIEFMKTEHIEEKLFSEARRITGEAEKITQPLGISFASVIEEGHPEKRIIETATRLGADLIVIGTYGWKGLNKAIMGSTTERVILQAPCPVLIVR
jgi:nucleotide-binding universal stress UspA family protein